MSIMKRKRWYLVILVITISGCIHLSDLKYTKSPYYIRTIMAIQKAGSQINVQDNSGALMAGTAKVNITPPIGTPLGGYGKRINVPSVGIHSQLYARALALSDGKDTVVIVGLDLVAVSDDIYNVAHTLIKEKIPLNRENLLISATHTHSGTGVMGKRFIERQAVGRFNKEIFEFTTEKIAQAVIRAYENLSPARIGAGKDYIQNLNINRMIAGGITDPEIAVLRVDNIKGAPIAYLINFAAHATVLGSSNLYICGDYPGWLQKEMEKIFPDTVAIFTSGAMGDIAPRLDGEFPSSFEKAKQMGRILSEKVLEISKAIKTHQEVEIICIGADIYLPPVQLKPLGFKVPTFLGRFFLDRKTFKNIILINDILLVALPCEPGVEIGLELKNIAREAGYFPYIITLANDWIGYVVPEKYYYTDEYEARMSFYGPKMDSYTKDIVKEFIRVLERRLE
ncbi:MAG: Neutral ceramidase [candidate division WS2 bacterium]|nr:Neutral ceramidase [Candidatus Psychracetigena formicireducens]